VSSPATTRGVDRTGRAVASIAAGSVFAVFTTLLGFWATPQIINALGSERFGLARALVDVFAYLGLLEFGLAGASRAALAADVASGDPSDKVAGLSLALRAHARATVWKVGGGLALIVFSPFLLRIGNVDSAEVRLAAAVLAFTMLSTPIGALQALVSAEQRDYSNNLVMGVQNVIITCSAVLFAWLRWGIPGQMAAQALGAIFTVASLVWLTLDTLNATRGSREPVNALRRQAFSKLNRANFWLILGGRLALLSDRITVGVLLGGGAVTSFHATIRLTDAVLPHVLGLGNAAWPAMADIHNRGEAGLFGKRLCEVTTTLGGLGVMVAAPILTVNRAFVDLWLGPGIFAGWALTAACCANVTLMGICSFWGWCFQSTRKIEALVPVTMVSSGANVAVSVVGTLLVGSAGPAVGTAVASSLLIVPWEMRLICRHFSVPLPSLLLAVTKPLALGLPYILACKWAASHWLVTRWDSVAFFAAASIAGWTIVAWATVFDRETRRAWRLRFKRLSARVFP
jgi:O-antigen/teichoic acid export membrane protein